MATVPTSQNDARHVVPAIRMTTTSSVPGNAAMHAGAVAERTAPLVTPFEAISASMRKPTPNVRRQANRCVRGRRDPGHAAARPAFEGKPPPGAGRHQRATTAPRKRLWHSCLGARGAAGSRGRSDGMPGWVRHSCKIGRQSFSRDTLGWEEAGSAETLPLDTTDEVGYYRSQHWVTDRKD
jgi:hypothetical protein